MSKTLIDFVFVIETNVLCSKCLKANRFFASLCYAQNDRQI